jgi:TatD DNase family protein
LFVDTHCHLNLPQFDADRAEAVARAVAAGVKRVVVPGTDLASSRQAVALAEKHPEVFAAVGVHPNDAQTLGASDLDELRQLAALPKVVAIGEIGLDLYWKSVPLTQQRWALEAQLQLAADLDKPAIVHDREAHAEVWEALAANRPPAGAVLHAFSGDLALAEAAVAEGFYLGIDGPLTYKNSHALQAIFAAVPLASILLETDAPYLTPQAHRGQRNEPAYVRYVAEKLAAIRQLAVEEVALATTANAARFFRWPSSPAPQAAAQD